MGIGSHAGRIFLVHQRRVGDVPQSSTLFQYNADTNHANFPGTVGILRRRRQGAIAPCRRSCNPLGAVPALHMKLTALVLAFMSTASLAQVIRCVDERSGKVTYTDSACVSNSKSAQIVPKQIAAQADAEREAAALARERFQIERAGLARRSPNEPTLPESQGRSAGRLDDSGPDKSKSVDCHRAKRNLDIAMSSIVRKSKPIAELVAVEAACGVDASKYGERQPVRNHSPPAPTQTQTPTPSVITACDVGGCWDNLGGRYNASGRDFIGPNGRYCTRSGNMVNCN